MKSIVRRIDLVTVMTAISTLALVALVALMGLALFSLLERGMIGDAIVIGGCILMSIVMVYYLIRIIVDNLKH